MKEYKAAEMPPRYGHSLNLLTSAIDSKGRHSEVFLNFGGGMNGAISSSANEDVYGAPYGGEHTSMFYLCPNVDIACAHSTFIGGAQSSHARSKYIHFTALLLMSLFLF